MLVSTICCYSAMNEAMNVEYYDWPCLIFKIEIVGEEEEDSEDHLKR